MSVNEQTEKLEKEVIVDNTQEEVCQEGGKKAKFLTKFTKQPVENVNNGNSTLKKVGKGLLFVGLGALVYGIGYKTGVNKTRQSETVEVEGDVIIED